MICEICPKEFTPRRPTQTVCSHRCANLRTAKRLGKRHFKRMGKAAWSPAARAKRQPPEKRSVLYKQGYQAGWKACERFYTQVVAVRTEAA